MFRQFLTLGLVANLLIAGFVGAVHVHEHGGDCESCTWPVAHAESPAPHCACGHVHASHTAPESGKIPAPAPPHDHDDCSICRLIATIWLPTAIATVVETPAIVAPVGPESTDRPTAIPTTRPRPRGPPRVA